MEICVTCYFDNKPEFEKALNYLKPIAGRCIEYNDGESASKVLYIEEHTSLTQDQLNELTALCPIRPRREISKQRVISKIAFGIGLHGMSYHPDDHLNDETWEDAKILGLDVYELAANLMEEFGIFNNKTK